MRKHRSLVVTKFAGVIDPGRMRRYLESLSPETPPSAWAEINGPVLDQWMNQPENVHIAEIIREDFRRINDICTDGMPLLVRAYKRAVIPIDQDLPAEDLAFLLFLDHRKAFEFAWSRYLLFAGAAKLSVHATTAKNIDFSDDSLRGFELSLSQWFSDQAKGQQCEISHFEDDGENLLLIRRGTYVRALPHWQGNELAVTALRPALEDIIVFERERGLIRIKTTAQNDRKEYLRLFALCILGDEKLAAEAESEEVFTLTPIQQGNFSFSGSGPITRVQLQHVKMRLYGVTEPLVEIRARDVAIAFEHDMQGLTLESGLLLSARLKFHIQHAGERATTRTFTISPPSRSDLPDRRDRQLILNYLEQQGVVLH